ncbi:hypothetical protein ABZX30_38235 [Streptomyces sp. NPDC004542]|uniref:hypothetical protein n=1 Tax=Streptomyces sp. NPDC004542 TaxID=3154281 RepID=UPI0033BDE560
MGVTPLTVQTPAWTLAGPVTHLTVLRAHLLHQRCLAELIALRSRTGVRLTLVCHQRTLPRTLERILARTQHAVADAEAVFSQQESPDDEPTANVLRRRWISLSALTTLMSWEDSPACVCAAPPWRASAASWLPRYLR